MPTTTDKEGSKEQLNEVDLNHLSIFSYVLPHQMLLKTIEAVFLNAIDLLRYNQRVTNLVWQHLSFSPDPALVFPFLHDRFQLADEVQLHVELVR